MSVEHSLTKEPHGAERNYPRFIFPKLYSFFRRKISVTFSSGFFAWEGVSKYGGRSKKKKVKEGKE